MITNSKKKNFLLVSPIMPYPLNYGTRIKVYELIKYLAPRCNLTLISLCHCLEDVKNANHIRSLNVEVCTVLIPNKKSFLHRIMYKTLYSFISLFFFIPQDLLYANCIPFRKKIKDISLSKRFDLVHFEYWWTGYMIKYFKNINNFVLEEDVEFIRYQREYRIKKFGFSKIFTYLLWKNTFKYEIKCCSFFKTILTVTPKDKEVLEEHLSNNIITSPFLLNINIGKLSPNNSNNLIFVGGNSPHNNDATLYLLRDIYPRIKKEISDVQLYVIGGELPQEIHRYNGSNGIFIPGYVPDLISYIDRCSILVAPLRIGSGIKGKIIEAMMHKRAVITTSVGVEGIGLTHEKDVIIADNTEDFIQGTIKLLREKTLRESLINNALQLVQEQYSKKAAYRKFFEIYGI
ncbi:MAG: glycosyltransferase family 4 protein [bacterium]|nr:glycosyltransferase family 4 protein [bacterium]